MTQKLDTLQAALKGALLKNRIHLLGAVRNDRYKYIHYVDLTQADELYDLQEDPFELKNIITDAAYAETLVQMKALLNEQLKQTGAQPM